MFREYFRGGVNLPQRTGLTKHSPFLNIAVPYICRFPLSQHTGKPAVPCVKQGDSVTEGQLIARADGDHSSGIHTSIPGRVLSLETIETIWGGREAAITIEARGGFPFFREEKPSDWQSMNSDTIFSAISTAGIVRLGGSPVPEHIRLPRKGDPVPEMLIVNAIESEPYLTTAASLLDLMPEQLVAGTRIIMHLTSAPLAVFAVESSTRGRTLDRLNAIIRNAGLGRKIIIKKIPPIYPYGADPILAGIIAKKRITPGELPKNHGLLIETAATVYAIHEAVTEKKPLYEKFITVSGSGISKPGNYKIRLGTPLSHIIEECGGLKDKKAVILAGGPMRGTIVESIDAPIDKKVSALLFLGKGELQSRKELPCIRCGSCVDRCPMGLNPRLLASKGTGDTVKLCIGCAVCSYVCPSGIDLSRSILARRTTGGHSTK